MDLTKENQLKHCLQMLVDPTAEMTQVQLVDNLQFLDTLVKEEGEALPPKLKHYLEKRSYVKALSCLDASQE
tara:strand:- start:27 stop:242 length:216 start_codon:yes stop_codon:yes gene_type:complete